MKKVSTTTKATKKPSLASRKVALRGIEDFSPQVTLTKEVASVIPFLIKTAVILGIGYFIYDSYTNRFIKLKENPNYTIANVTQAQAKSRADAIIGSLGWFSNSFDAVSNSLAGLNYNGFIRVYNEFGHQKGTLLGGDLNLVEWIKNQFTEYEVSQLSLLLNAAFFKAENPDALAIQLFFNSIPKRLN